MMGEVGADSSRLEAGRAKRGLLPLERGAWGGGAGGGGQGEEEDGMKGGRASRRI